MNTYARMKDPLTENKNQRKYRTGERGNAGSVWRIALPVIGIVFMVCGASLLRVYFKAKTESLAKETAILESRIKVQRQELACLRNREAQFTTRTHVMGKLRHAGLRAPEYGQVTHVALLSPDSQFQKKQRNSLALHPEERKARNYASNTQINRR